MEYSSIMKVTAAALFVAGLSLFVFFTYAPGTGSPVLWEAGEEEPVRQFFPWGGDICTIGANSTSLLNSSGHSLWTAAVSGSELAAIGADDRLYVYSAGHRLQRIGRTGQAEAVGTYPVDRPPLADANGMVYLQSGLGLTAVATNVTTLWNDTGVVSAAVLDGAGGVMYLTCPSGQPADASLLCRLPDGSLKWSLQLQNYDGSVALVQDGAAVYVSRNTAGELYRVLDNGTVMWKYYKPYLGRYTLATDEAGRLYLVYDQGTVHVLNPDGDMIGKFQAGLPDTPEIEGVAAGNGTLYLAVGGSTPASVNLSALDVNGTCLWKTTVNSTGPVRLIPAGNMVCAATEITRNGHTVPVIFVLDSDGSLEYAYYAPRQGSWEKVCAADGAIYALSSEGRLYALKLPEKAQG